MNDVVQMVSDRLRSKPYVSEDTRRYLEKFARLLAPFDDVDVHFDNCPTARTRVNGERLAIDITNNPIEQPTTSMEDDAWQLLAREALLIHEVGHVLYTDFDALEDYKPVQPKKNKHWNRIQNALEDAVVDQQLRWKFDCGDELDAHLANLFRQNENRQSHLDFMGAVNVAILEKGVYEVGLLEEYHKGERQLPHADVVEEFEEALELVDEVLVDLLTDPDPETRYERCWEFFEEIWDLKPDYDPGTDAQDPELPDDIGGGSSGDAQQADELEDVDPEDVKQFIEQAGEPDVEDEEDGEEEDGRAGDEPTDAEDEQEEGEAKGKGKPDEEAEDDAGSGGSGEGGGDGGSHPYPEHKGHRLVVKD